MKAVAWAEMVDLPENRSAVLAAKRCLRPLLKPEGAAPAPHPLLIHGQAGTGKSLLVGLMLRRLTAHPAGITARSLAARELPRRKPDSPKDEGNADFADLLALDFLAVEDAQHLPARAVPGFVELLDHRAARRRVTVVTASAGPANLTRLPRRLTSRLAGGLVVQLGAVGRASRWVLLLRVAERKGLSLTDEAITAVVDATAGGGLRPMLGVLDSLKTVTRGKSSLARPLDAAAVRSLLESAQAPDAGTPIEVIIAHVAAAYGVTAKELLGPSRRRDTLLPRHVAMYLARETTPLSLPQIGAAFGGRDHTTVLHACRKIAAGLKADAKLARTLRELKAEIS